MLVFFGDKFQQNTIISSNTGAVEVCGCEPVPATVYYFEWEDNRWYRKYEYIDGKCDTTIYNIDSSDDYRYLMTHLIKDEDLGIPNTTEIIGIYVEPLNVEKQLILENGEVIDNVLQVDDYKLPTITSENVSVKSK